MGMHLKKRVIHKKRVFVFLIIILILIGGLLYYFRPWHTQLFSNIIPSEVFHLRGVSPDIPLKEILHSKALAANSYWLQVKLDTRTLYFKDGDEILKQYRISAGKQTNQGDKEKEGDYRTPKGKFYICSKDAFLKSQGYLGTRWMLLSYPGLEAAERGLKHKIITQKVYDAIVLSISHKNVPPQDTPLGSAVGIHGGGNPALPKDWTAGCIGMYDQDIEEIYEFVKPGTLVIIE
jgi:lipoprotein-anchoring transpeptidase ErfK/SrfK